MDSTTGLTDRPRESEQGNPTLVGRDPGRVRVTDPSPGSARTYRAERSFTRAARLVEPGWDGPCCSSLWRSGTVHGGGISLAVPRTVSWPTVVSYPAVSIAFGLSVLVGVFFGLYPARKASRLNPIDALRYE